jgi:hypothetical protein
MRHAGATTSGRRRYEIGADTPAEPAAAMARSRVGSGSNGARRQVATSASRSSSTPRNPPGRGAPTPPTSRRSTTGAPSRNPFRHAEIRSGLLMTCREREGWRGRRNSWRPRHTVLRLLPEGRSAADGATTRLRVPNRRSTLYRRRGRRFLRRIRNAPCAPNSWSRTRSRSREVLRRWSGVDAGTSQ